MLQGGAGAHTTATHITLEGRGTRNEDMQTTVFVSNFTATQEKKNSLDTTAAAKFKLFHDF